MCRVMLPPEKLSLRRWVLAGDGCELWARTRTLDQQRYGPATATHLALLNTGTTLLHITAMEVCWATSRPFRWHRPGVIEPRCLLDPAGRAQFGMLVTLTRHQGLQGFGAERTMHQLVVRLDRPWEQQLAVQVSSGFATPGDDLGFFLPALEGAGDGAGLKCSETGEMLAELMIKGL